MTQWKWLTATVALVLAYVAIVLIAGFGNMAIPIHFGRVALAVGVLVLFVPGLSTVFRQVPAPRRDYLLAGIICTWSSAIGFAIWNEMGRQFGVDTSIFTSPIAGFLSLLLVIGGGFHIVAPDELAGKQRRFVAVAIGITAGVAITLVAPLFR